jgi:hypothetical protein
VTFVLLRDKSIHLVSELLAPYLDGGISPAMVDLKDWKINLMVSRRPVVSIIPEIKSKDS